MYNRNIIVAYDGSPGSNTALRLALDFAKTVSAKLTLVYVVDLSTLDLSALVYTEGFDLDRLKHALLLHGEQILAAGKKQCAEADAQSEGVSVIGNPPDEIIKLAHKERAELIVVGSRGKGGFEQLMIGSVAQAVMAHSDVSVLIAK